MLLKLFYFYGAGCGLMPALLRKRKFLRGSWQRGYLIYTACLHGVLLVLLPFTFPQYMYDESYMSGNLVLQWVFNLTNITRIFAMISGGFMMWSKREKLQEMAVRTFNHCQKCKKLGNDSSLRKSIRGLLGQYFFVLNLSILVAFLLLSRIDTDQCFRNATMIVVHILQFTYVVIMTAALYVILVFLHWQNERVNMALKELSFSLHHEERNSLVLSAGKARRSLNNLRNLFQLYSENQRLSREVFGIFDLPIALLLLKLFVTNVNLVYHGVQFGNDSIETSMYTKFVGQLVVITHYWSAVLLMNVVDDITRRSGPKMGDILREFNDLELVKREFHLQLELFSDHVRCHPATYKVCGLFVFNKQTSLVYFFYVLVQVLVLVQFDLKNKVDRQ
ncbi:putative gustatory receptor 58a [Drosophila serrata]|uniref:putative gustatory receptor 58a n=1 Tax=Drosophila serrata TaxID=7274 RepID=UPI000A1CFA32|nr:putative gustatory receptor 58a [Drosophila serrata]KAH8355626.1 hypothetical protein KR200_006742 [Drosophila serrata]